MKKLLAILLCATALHAQDHLKNFRNKTAKQIANVSHLLRMDTTFFHVRIGEKGRDLAAAIEGRGLTPSDFATIKAALDTSIFRKNRLIFPPGTFTVDSLGIYSPITLSGVGIKRIKTTDSDYYGSIIKSTNTTGLPLIKVYESGVFLHDISLQGTLTDGHGYYSQRPYVSGSINSTLGGYGLARVNSFNHGGSGFYIVGPDGNIFDELETFNNRAYGVVAISPSEAGLVSAGATAAGTTSLFRGGRSRRNKLGGWLISDQAAVGLQHIEAIADTSIGVWFDAGRSRSYMLGTDVEMQIPALTSTPLTTGVRVEDMQGFLMAQNFIGTQHEISTTYTADSGTNTTTIVDAALVNYGPNGYFIGWDVVNSTRSSGEVKITGYTASTGTLTLTSAIASQTTGDSYTLSKDQNVGLRLHNLTSGVFINNTFGSNVDTMIATVGDGGALFVNNINFDPEDNLKAISGTFKYLYINTANVDSLSGGANTILMKSNKDFIIQSLDSLLLRSTGANKGTEISAAGKVAIQPEASGGVHLFGNVGDDENPDLRVYYDADTTTVTTNKKYYDFAGSLTQPNIFSIQNVDSTQTLSFGTPVRFSGSTSERYFDIQHHQAGTHGGTPSNGFVRFWSRGDTAFVTDDNGTERSLYAGSGLGDVVGPASSTNTAVARFDGTTGKLLKNTSTLTLSDAGAFSFADGVTQVFNPNGTSSGLNVGSQAGDPSTPANGDVWYDGTANELTARINGANVALGAGGGAPTSATYITQTADGTLSAEQALGSLATGILASTTTTGVVASRTLTGTAGAVSVTNGDGSANPTFTLPSAITVPTSYAIGSDPADAGVVRLENDAVIGWEASPAGTDVTLKVDASEILQASGAFNTGGAITEATNAVPNATDHLGFFAATTSSQLAGVVSDETGTGALVLGTSPTITTSLSQDGEVADAGYLRLQNAANIAWEASPAGTDVTLGVDASEILQSSTTLNATALTEATNAVPNATDHLGFFAATTSAQLAGVLSDEVGTDGGFLRVEATGASAGNTIVRRASGVWVDSTLSGSGDVVGPASSTDEAIARFDLTTGKLLQNTSTVTLSDAGAFSLPDGVKQTFNPNGTTSGLNVGAHTANPSSLANGDVWYNSTTNKLMGREGGVSYPIVNDYDPSTTFAIYDDFVTGSANTSGAMGSANWQRTIAVSGTTTHQNGEAGRPGIMQLFCSGSAGSTAALHSHTTSWLFAGNEYYKGSVKFSTLGTAGSNGALYRMGWADGTGTAYPSNGAWIEFNVDSSATRWRAITANGGTRTITTDAVLTVAAGTWYKLEITFNAAATSVIFAVDGTTIATHTTNIPTANPVGALMFAGAVTASATKNSVIDYVLYMTSGLSR